MLKQKRRGIIYKVFTLAALIASVILLVSMIQKIDPELIRYGDSFQYWAAGRIFLSGENPYEFDRVAELRPAAGYTKTIDKDAISMMLYPPWIFPILVPFSMLGYSVSRMLWLFFHIIIVFLASRTIWFLYKGPKKYEILTYIVAFTFTPTFYVLGIGHISTLHLFGVSLFLLLIPKRTKLTDLAAGLALGLILLKPQLLFIYLIALSLWIIYTRRWWILVGILIFIALNLTFALTLNLEIISQYFESITKYPMGTWATPTLGMLLRLVFGINKDWLQIIPSIIGILWIFIYWLNRRQSWDWYEETPLVLLVSFTLSPYTWTYDMVILVIPILYLLILFIKEGRKLPSILSIAVYVILNIAALIFHRTRADFWFFWFAPSLLIWFILTKKMIYKPLKIQLPQGLNLEEDI